MPRAPGDNPVPPVGFDQRLSPAVGASRARGQILHEIDPGGRETAERDLADRGVRSDLGVERIHQTSDRPVDRRELRALAGVREDLRDRPGPDPTTAGSIGTDLADEWWLADPTRRAPRPMSPDRSNSGISTGRERTRWSAAERPSWLSELRVGLVAHPTTRSVAGTGCRRARSRRRPRLRSPAWRRSSCRRDLRDGP